MELRIDRSAVLRAREMASAIVDPIDAFIARHTTTSVERAIARLCDVDGVDADGIPLPHRLVDALAERESGVAAPLGAAIARTGRTPQEIAESVAAGEQLPDAAGVSDAALRAALVPYVERALARIDARRTEREAYLARLPQARPPLLYVIVASGNIYEDRVAAVAAAEAGAQIVAVIRSTAQSLLDYVPYGATTEGFGGTYATQENVRIMRAALDEASERLGRYVMLTNYASGLCMPEIAAIGALERLDMLLNDSMYGILFRDINMQRTFVDQHFSRQLSARAGIVINTGEDNYLTTADAVEQAPAVLASQFINEAFAHRAGLPDAQLGLGDAFEIDPNRENSFLYQLAQAQLARQIFPDAPLKYMPPTKHMTGNIFKGHLVDAMFNLASVMTGQTIHLCGMMTEAIHTPFLGDRAVALENARYIMGTARDLGDELQIKPGGIVERRAREVLDGALRILERVAERGLMTAIEDGTFADVRRAREGGRGLEGVFARGERYWNPFAEQLAGEVVR
jgi:beta-lysine 5,6-aminomutase alpha subunit